MGKSKRPILVAMIMACVLMVSAACATGPAQRSGDTNAPAQAGGKKVLNIGITGTPMDLNAIDPGDTASELLLHMLYLPLTELQSDMSFKPMLASSVTTKDNTVFTIVLNPKANWTDGKPVTTDDVIFTLGMITDPKGATMTAQSFTMVKGIDDKGKREGETISGLKKVDDKTLEVTLKAPMSMNLFQSSFCRFLVTIPQHIYQDVLAADFGKDSKVQNPKVTNGPYTLTEFKRDQHVQFAKNADYFMGAPIIDTVVFKVVTAANMTVQLQNGELHMNFAQLNTIAVEDVEKVKQSSGLDVTSGDPATVLFLFTNNETFANPKTRQAMSMAINRDLIVNKVIKGYAEVGDTFFTSNNPYRDTSQQATPFDVDKAKALLSESGWDTNKTVTLYTSSTNKLRDQVTNVIAQNLQAIGMKVSIQKVDHAVAMGKAKKGDYDLIIMGDNLIPVDPTYDMPFFLTEGNWNKYASPTMNELFTKVRSQTDDAVVKSTLGEVQKLMRSEVPLIVIGSTKNISAKSKKLVVGGPKDFGTLSDIEKWDLAG